MRSKLALFLRIGVHRLRVVTFRGDWQFGQNADGKADLTASGPIQVIINPISGRGAARRLVSELCRLLVNDGIGVTIEQTQGPGQAATLAHQAEAAGCRAIVVVGGDGTINETVGGLSDSAPPLLIVPAGTENILAKHFRTRKNAEWLRGVVLAGRTAEMDVPTANGRRFLMVSGVGFDAECVRRVTLARRGRITYANYFLPIWRAFWSYKHPRLRVEADGATIFEGQGLAIVGNVRRYAWGLQPALRAVPDDGLLDVIACPCTWQGPLLMHALRTIVRRQLRGDVVYRQARRIRITTEMEAGVQVDGDWGGVTPVEYEMSGRRARFLVGPDFAG